MGISTVKMNAYDSRDFKKSPNIDQLVGEVFSVFTTHYHELSMGYGTYSTHHNITQRSQNAL